MHSALAKSRGRTRMNMAKSQTGKYSSRCLILEEELATVSSAGKLFKYRQFPKLEACSQIYDFQNSRESRHWAKFLRLFPGLCELYCLPLFFTRAATFGD